MDATLSQETFTAETPIRFNVPLKTGETDFSKRISISILANTDLKATIMGEGRVSITSRASGTYTPVIRIWFIK